MSRNAPRLEPSPGLDVTVFEVLLATCDVHARSALACQLAALVCDKETAQIEVDQVGPILKSLASDQAKEVRVLMAEALHDAERLAPDVAFVIAADEDDIALPFLAKSPVIKGQLMMAILQVGDDARKAAVAARANLADEAKLVIITSGSANTALPLLDNSAVKFSARDYAMLYNRFGNNAAVVEKLLTKEDLPADIRIIQAKRAAVRVRQMMLERGWVPANDAADICIEAEDNAVMQVLLDANPARRAAALAYMVKKGLLTPAFIVRAAATGQMSIVEAALAHLTNTTPPRSAEQMYAENPHQFKSLFRKSGLPQSCFGVLRAACDVVIDMRQEGLELSSADFGGRVLEALLTRYETMSTPERAKQIEFVGRYGEEKIRKVAQRLKADIVRAA